jgi:hypothetical protein
MSMYRRFLGCFVLVGLTDVVLALETSGPFCSSLSIFHILSCQLVYSIYIVLFAGVHSLSIVGLTVEIAIP